MKVINKKPNSCKEGIYAKPHKNQTKQLEFYFMNHIGSHTIYNVKSTYLSDSLHKLVKPIRTVRLNKVGSSNSLDISVNQIKSFYKDVQGVCVEVCNLSTPILVRESLDEINNLINKRRN